MKEIERGVRGPRVPDEFPGANMWGDTPPLEEGKEEDKETV